jgi:hypothetical protein
MDQMSRKEQKRILKQLGLKFPDRKKTSEELSQRIEEGKNKHRMFVQEVKNKEIMDSLSKNSGSIERNDIFIYRGQESPDYSNFNSLLLKANWDETGESEE